MIAPSTLTKRTLVQAVRLFIERGERSMSAT